MAVYKVPQDVEADDKLLGPFSFRQFIYLIIVAMACGIGFLLFKIFAPLVVIVLPIVIFFGALALPLKKDQPMEAYLGAMISFYFLKPRKRFWQPDGLNSLVEITAPKTEEQDLTKNISEQEARQRLSYLSDIVESQGWAVRGQGVATQGMSSMPQQDDSDLLGSDNVEAQRLDQLLDTRDERGMSELRNNFQQQMAAPAPQPTATPQIQYNPYPAMHQAVMQPQTQAQAQPQPTPTAQPAPQPTNPPETTSINTPSPDIIRLANESSDISVASVAEQAHRLEKQHGLPEDEVEISLH